MIVMKLQKTRQQQDQIPILNNPFQNLTEEIIFIILDYLNDDPLAKKSFSLVNKWFHYIESIHRWRLKPLRTDGIPSILSRYPHISHLDLTFCAQIQDENLATIADAYRVTLRFIDLSRSRSFTKNGLSNLVVKCSALVSMDLSNATELTDLAAAAIAEAKNLESLSLGRWKLISDIGIGCIAVGCKKLKSICLKWCLRVSDLGVGLIAMKCKNLCSLDLSYLPITEKCLPPILQLQQLKELILVGCSGIDDNGLATLNHGSKPLETLNMSNCQNISHLGLSYIASGMECLKHLNLAYGSVVAVDLAKCLHNFPSLHSLRLDGCQIACSGLKSIVKCSVSLKELSLSKCSGVTDECISSITDQMHNGLEKLDITCCREITRASLENITSSFTSLTSLRMESCNLVPDEAFLLIGQNFLHLEELDITDNLIDDEGMKSISRCTKLASLKLGICAKVTDYGLSHVGMHCKKLKELDLYRCIEIADPGITAIANGCLMLEKINMAYCDKVTNASLVSLSKTCLQLKVLEIRGCPCVSSTGLSAIAKECRQLSVLDIKKCHGIDDNGIFALAQYSSSLQQMNLSYCSVTDIGLMALSSISRLQNITILHVNGLTSTGLANALLACRGLMKVKFHSHFKTSMSESILNQMEDRGCVFHWRKKSFQVSF